MGEGEVVPALGEVAGTFVACADSRLPLDGARWVAALAADQRDDEDYQ